MCRHLVPLRMLLFFFPFNDRQSASAAMNPLSSGLDVVASPMGPDQLKWEKAAAASAGPCEFFNFVKQSSTTALNLVSF
jgi:hypothetical protein